MDIEERPIILARLSRLPELQFVIHRIDWIHLDILRMSIRGTRRSSNEVDRAEMHQLPLPLTVRIRRSFQRHREPHGQYGIDAGNRMSRHSQQRTKRDKRTVRTRFIA